MKINNNSFAVNAQVLSTLIEVLTMGNLENVILVKELKKEKSPKSTRIVISILKNRLKILLLLCHELTQLMQVENN